MTAELSRRDFVRAVAATSGALMLAVSIEGCAGEPTPASGDATFAPDAWIRLDRDGTVTVMVAHSEMGQGVATALPMLVAEELDADWSRVRWAQAPANRAYFNPAFGAQGTGGSTSVRTSWTPLREAGARARAMLVAAAATRLGVPAAELRTERGVVIHQASGRRVPYGDLAEAAARLPVPATATLKDPKTFTLIGHPVPRIDLDPVVRGGAVFAMDVVVPGMLYASVERCPVFGGTVRRVDDAAARQMAGVRDVVVLRDRVAVVAEHYWQAVSARRKLKVEWDEGATAQWSDDTIGAHLQGLADGSEAALARHEGDVDAALARAAKVVEATYEVPYLAHATMEPMNCTVDARPESPRVWAPTQFQAGPAMMKGGARGVVAAVAGVDPEQVEVITTRLGGGFGRRFELDFIEEAAWISRHVQAPVHVIWTREDDVRHDYYRPRTFNRLKAGLDADGNVVAWRHAIAGPSIMAKFLPGFLPTWITHRFGPLKGGVDGSSVEGAADLPYAVPNIRVTWAQADLGIPVGFWRSVGHSQNAFIVEGFVDELASAAGKDPVAFRRALLKDHPRHVAVLDAVAERAGWSKPLPRGRARGVAVHDSFGSIVAEVAEVSVERGELRVHKVTCAVDCGQVVNPDTVAAQMESGIVFGLSAVLSGKISIERGRVKESNFPDYPVLRMDRMPEIDVVLVPSGDALGGVGEPGTPPIAPAVANALYALTGQRVRSLPIRLGQA
jgi:isoquinoline 1-oxidoreductase beta subunit